MPYPINFRCKPGEANSTPKQNAKLDTVWSPKVEAREGTQREIKIQTTVDKTCDTFADAPYARPNFGPDGEDSAREIGARDRTTAFGVECCFPCSDLTVR